MSPVRVKFGYNIMKIPNANHYGAHCMLFIKFSFQYTFMFKMSYYKSSSKTSHIQCRVESCGKTMIKQHYKAHLETQHPEENSDDLREKGQPKLFLFNKKIKFSAAEKGIKSSENIKDDKLLPSSAVGVQCVDDQCSSVSNYTESETYIFPKKRKASETEKCENVFEIKDNDNIMVGSAKSQCEESLTESNYTKSESDITFQESLEHPIEHDGCNKKN